MLLGMVKGFVHFYIEHLYEYGPDFQDTQYSEEVIESTYHMMILISRESLWSIVLSSSGAIDVESAALWAP